MDFKAQMVSGKAVEKLADGVEQAPFAFDFSLDAKALESTVDANGDLWIEGYASDFEVDRQDEAFEPGAFQRGLKTFLGTNPIMLYHHQYDKALGQFVDGRIDERGLWVKGRVDAPAPGSWAEDVFNKIKKGTIKAFSVGGIFRRRMTPNGPRIFDCDLGEISVTPFPVNPRTTFALAAQKAFESKAEEVEEVEVEVETVKPDGTEKTETELAAEAAAKVNEDEVKPDEPVEEEPKDDDDDEVVVKPGTITGEHIVAGSITADHLSDDLRRSVQEWTPEAPSVEAAHERLGTLATQLETVFDKLGIETPTTQEVVHAA